MPRIQPLASLLFLIAFALPAAAQPLFRVIPSNVATPEGGQENVLLIQAGDENFSVRIPKGYGTQVRPESCSIVFTAENGASTITVQVTTNYPGALPKMEDLRDIAAKKHPGASLVQSSTCISDYGMGLCFDLFQPGPSGLMLRMRDAYFSYPEGSFEFLFSCNGADYDKSRLSFAWLLNSLRSRPGPVKKEP